VALTVTGGRLGQLEVVTEDPGLQRASRLERALRRRRSGRARLPAATAPQQSEQDRQGRYHPAGKRRAGAIHHG
jgi:hypothetical protein